MTSCVFIWGDEGEWTKIPIHVWCHIIARASCFGAEQIFGRPLSPSRTDHRLTVTLPFYTLINLLQYLWSSLTPRDCWVLCWRDREIAVSFVRCVYVEGMWAITIRELVVGVGGLIIRVGLRARQGPTLCHEAPATMGRLVVSVIAFFGICIAMLLFQFQRFLMVVQSNGRRRRFSTNKNDS